MNDSELEKMLNCFKKEGIKELRSMALSELRQKRPKLPLLNQSKLEYFFYEKDKIKELIKKDNEPILNKYRNDSKEYVEYFKDVLTIYLTIHMNTPAIKNMEFKDFKELHGLVKELSNEFTKEIERLEDVWGPYNPDAVTYLLWNDEDKNPETGYHQ